MRGIAFVVLASGISVLAQRSHQGARQGGIPTSLCGPLGNAALAEQSAAASQALLARSATLGRAVGVFRVGG